MPSFRAALAALALSIPLAIPVHAQEGGTTEDVQRALAAGWKATFTCSGLFVAGQTLQELDQNELSGIYPDYVRFYDQLPPAKIDQSRKTVSVDYSPLMPPRMAAYRPGYGCTQLPIGATEKAIDFLPRFASWPEYTTQDRGSAIGSNVKVELRLEEAQRLEMPVTSAFDETTYGVGTKTSSVIVVRDGQVVAERYARGVEHETPQRTWSVGKSITATEITIRNLLHMASGLDSGENGSRTDRLYFGGGRVVDQAATGVLEVEPGSRFKYANNDTVVTMRALREAIADDARFHRFPYEEVLHKIGAVRTTLEIDWNGDFISSSQVWATGRDLARVGQLYLQDGMWAGERLLPEGWMDFVRTPAPAQPADAASRGGYGAQFWLMNNVPGVPEGTFYAAGNRGQYIVIIPQLSTVVVRQGYDTIGGARFDIDRFVLDVTRAIEAADQDRGLAAEDLRRAAEAENAPAARRPR
ncbi:MAG: serine hydrolase [Hyphomonas sp. 34-62-18]|nr:serine hydrolase [Hyphomonas sp. 34-62-18]OZB13109.1 MAG: serine hydrolase [Hyphomonas sp. 34-62-18]